MMGAYRTYNIKNKRRIVLSGIYYCCGAKFLRNTEFECVLSVEYKFSFCVLPGSMPQRFFEEQHESLQGFRVTLKTAVILQKNIPNVPNCKPSVKCIEYSTTKQIVVKFFLMHLFFYL